MKRLLVALVLVVVSVQPLVGDDRNPGVLKGLVGVRVVVEELSDHAKEAGLTKQSLRIAAELRLRTHGIRVLTNEERLSSPSGAYLYVNVSAFKRSYHEGLVYDCSVSLREAVTLLRGSQQKVNGATTWRAAVTFGITPSNDFANEIVSLVKEQVDEFINDYLRDNPREQAPSQGSSP